MYYHDYYKIIRFALKKYESKRLARLKEKGWGDELHREIRAAALELCEFGDFQPALAFKKANIIKTTFIDVILGKRTWQYLKRPAPLQFSDIDALQCIETLYLCGGAAAIYAVLPCKGERYPREIAKLCSQAFGYRTLPGETAKKDPNSIRYTEARRRYAALLAEGYTPRASPTGSVYLEKEGRKIRFSQHTGVALLQLDIAEFFYVNETFTHNLKYSQNESICN